MRDIDPGLNDGAWLLKLCELTNLTPNEATSYLYAIRAETCSRKQA